MFQHIRNNVTCFNNGTKLFQTAVNTATLRGSFFFNVLQPWYNAPTFQTKALQKCIAMCSMFIAFAAILRANTAFP